MEANGGVAPMVEGDRAQGAEVASTAGPLKVFALPRVRHQVVRLTIDPRSSTVCGRADLFLSLADLAEQGATGLRLHCPETQHQRGFSVEAVTVNGKSAPHSCLAPRAGVGGDYGVSSSSTLAGADRKKESVHSKGLTRFADDLWHRYYKKLAESTEPNLLVDLSDLLKGLRDNSKAKEEGVFCLTVEYTVSEPQGQALRFHGAGYCFVGSHFMPLRSWAPCVEGRMIDGQWESSEYPLSLELSVPPGLRAVAGGRRLSEDAAEGGGTSHKFVSDPGCPTSSMFFAVGPFEEVESAGFEMQQADPKRPSVGVRLFADGSRAAGVGAMATFLKGAMEDIVDYLECPFPFPHLSVCFLPAEAALDVAVAGVGVLLLSEDLVSGERGTLGQIEARTCAVRALAEQWFGVLVRSPLAEERWLASGLAGSLAGKVVAKHFGENEGAYQWSRKLDLVVAEQDDASPSIAHTGQAGFGLAQELQRYTSSHVLRHKADLLVWMVENRTGAEPFQKVVKAIVQGALKETSGTVGCRLTCEDFFDRAAKVFDSGVDKNWLQSFNERWIVGRGCPHVVVAFCFNRKQHAISVALKQSGLKSANVSGTAAVKCCGKESSGLGMITLVTGETDGVHRNKVFLGDQSLVLEEIKCHGKLAAKKRKRKDDKEETPDEKEPCGPVKWLDVHHNFEWFASFEVSQPEKMWINQLESSRNVVVQLHAVAGLGGADKPSYATVNALEACVKNREVYHRVRSEAAVAIARTVGESTNWGGITVLLNLYRECFFNPDTFSPISSSASGPSSKAGKRLEAADQLVSHSTSVAIGLLRDEDGHSPHEAADFLLELLKFAPHDGIAPSADERIAYLLKGVGLLAVDSEERLGQCLGAVRAFLQREKIFMSEGMSITCACMQSVCSLLMEFYRRNPGSDCTVMDEHLLLIKTYASGQHIHRVRTVANICIIILESIRHGCKRAFQTLLDVLEDETEDKVKASVVEGVKGAFVLYRRTMHEPLSTGDMQDITEAALDGASPVQLTYKIFELVQQLGRRPLCLNRTSDEVLHRDFFVKLHEEQTHHLVQMQTETDRRVARPSKKAVVIPDEIEPDAPPSPGMQSFTMESGHTFEVNQRVRGKWRNGNQWYGGKIAKIHHSGTFDIKYDDGDLERDVPIARMIPEGGWQFTSASAQELTDGKKTSASKQSKLDLKQLGDSDSKSLYAKLVSETSKEKPMTEEEKKQKLAEELMRLASKILNGLRSAKAAQYFMRPVSAATFGGETQEEKEKAYNEYLKVIEGKPMDLGTVTEQTRGGKYESPLQFRDDVRQIFINSRKFNADHPESIVFKSGEKLSETFETKWKESHIEELWEAGEIRPLIHRVESRAHSVYEGHRSDSYKRGKVKFEDEHTQKMWSLCLLVLKDVKTHPKAWPFLKPVDPVKDSAPNYFEIVKEPMDFNKITDKLASRVYEKVSEFKADMELVFSNCRLYNKKEDNVVRKAGDELEVFFRQSWEKHDVESKLHTEKKVLTKEDEMMKECDRIVHFLKKHKYAQPFLRPVTAEILPQPELWAKYQDVVKCPMDISTLANNQRRRKYKTIEEFKDDVSLIFQNCFNFNFKGDPVHKAGKHLKHGFLKRWKKLEEKFGIERLKPEAEAWKRTQRIVDEIISNDLSISFRQPVDKISVPDYYDVIKTPIDLGVIQSKVQAKAYPSPVEVKADMELLFANCKQYNKEGDPAMTRGEELKKVFDGLWQEAKVEELMAESACMSGEDSMPLTMSEGGTLLPETTLLTNDSGLTQDTSKHTEVLSKEKPLEEHSPVKMDVDAAPPPAPAPVLVKAEVPDAGASNPMDVDEEPEIPKVSVTLPKIKLKSLPPKKAVTEGREESETPTFAAAVAAAPSPSGTPLLDQEEFTPFQHQECVKLLFMLKKNKWAPNFVDPVTAATFGDPALWQKYQQIVTRPMDLTTIHESLKSKVLRGPKEVWEGVTQIFENCYKFNYAVDPVYKSAVELQRVFAKRWAQFEKKFGLTPQAARGLGEIFADVDDFMRRLAAHDTYESLKRESEKLRDAGGIPFCFDQILGKLGTRDYTDPTQVRDEIRYQFNALLAQSEGDDLLHSNAEDFNKVFLELWAAGDFERKFSRCRLHAGKASPAKPVKRESRRDEGGGTGGEREREREEKPTAVVTPPPSSGGLTLKIKFGGPKKQ